MTLPVVLVVDDEAANLKVFNRVFRNTFDLILASTWEETEAALADRTPAIAFVDYAMPELDGLGFLAELHRVTPTTVCYLLTGYGGLPETDRAVEERLCVAVLAKPWSRDDIARAVAARAGSGNGSEVPTWDQSATCANAASTPRCWPSRRSRSPCTAYSTASSSPRRTWPAAAGTPSSSAASRSSSDAIATRRAARDVGGNGSDRSDGRVDRGARRPLLLVVLRQLHRLLLGADRALVVAAVPSSLPAWHVVSVVVLFAFSPGGFRPVDYSGGLVLLGLASRVAGSVHLLGAPPSLVRAPRRTRATGLDARSVLATAARLVAQEKLRH